MIMRKGILLLACMALFAILPASAWNFTYNGLYYTYESSTDTLCFVDRNYDAHYPMPSGDVVIPSKAWNGIDSVWVVAIGDYGLSNCPDLKSVTLPPTVSRVWNYAFDNSGIETITIPPTVTTLGSNLFSNTPRLVTVNFPENCTQILNYDFYNSAIQYINFPSSMMEIGSYAFEKCSNLKSITFPKSIKNIDEKAFWQCSNLTDITVEDGDGAADDRIWCGDYPFENCPITNVYMGRNVQGYHSPLYGFINEDNLKNLTIGKNVTVLPEYRWCNNIEKVVSNVENPFAFSNVFSEAAYSNATLYVPQGTIDAYKSTEGWLEFKNIKEQSTTGIKAVDTNAKNATVKDVFSVDGKKLQQPQKGINIVRYTDGTTKEILK